MEGGFNHLYIITHTDLDGVGSAAATLLASGRSISEATILYAEPYNIDSVIREIAGHMDKGDLLVIADLGPNRDSFGEAVRLIKTLTGRGVRVEWYDHHVWSEDETAQVEAAGAKLVIDKSTCATGVVARYMPGIRGRQPPEVLPDLEAAVCAADLWRWDHPLAPKLFRVADHRYEDGREAWRNKLVEKFSKGILWDEELSSALEEYVNLELANFNTILATAYVTPPPCIVAAVFKFHGPPSNSIVGASLLSRHNADIAVIVRDNGGISLRSRRVDVQVVAKALGGGGHPRAAGARIKIGVITRLASYLLGRKRLAAKAAKMVRRKALKLGVC
ncbi:MAG: DHHA1 domain-containing protein [Desulfurococcales archaeon]|nr:DHHA1 domain-containing protein [Desulfurococcales archaeon]